MLKDQKRKGHTGQLGETSASPGACLQGKQELTQVFLHDMGGVVQAILGNTELLKVKYAHKLNHEAMSHLHKIEENSENLACLLKGFQQTVLVDSSSASHGTKGSADSGEKE